MLPPWLVLGICLTLSSALAAGEPPCPPGNLLEGARVEAQAVRGNTQVITDGTLTFEGMGRDAPVAVQFSGPSSIVIDLTRPRVLNGLLLQADHDDAYAIESSLDGWSWQPVWEAPIVAGPDLRTRATRLPSPAVLRYLRVSGVGGDGQYAISELRGYCRIPESAGAGPPPRYDPGPQPVLARNTVRAIKALVALLGLMLFLWGIALRRAERPAVDHKLRSGLLLGLSLSAGLLFWNLGQFNFTDYVHYWDQYHYYLGAKYSHELGYTRLYECTVVADVEDSPAQRSVTPKIRDLETNSLVSTEGILGDPERCKRHFDADRWTAFKRDLSWFREKIPDHRWSRLLRDHGYNATPAWEALASRLANLGPASDRLVLLLALLDPILLLGMWVLVYRTFGWRALALALLFWGTNHVAGFAWTGGGFLRQDWFALTLAGICLVQRKKMFWGGAVLAYATLLRIVPGFLVAGLVLKALAVMWRTGRFTLSPEHRRFAVGSLSGLALVFLFSLSAPMGAGAWRAFADNSATYLGTPGTNTIGLSVLLSYEHATRMERMRKPSLEEPDRDWKAARRDILAKRRILQGLLVAAFLILLVRTVAREEDWVALVLGLGLIPIVTAPASYYYAVFAGYGLLWVRSREPIGAMLCGLSLATYLCLVVWSSGVEYDERFAWTSLATLVFVFVVSTKAAPPDSGDVEPAAGPVHRVG